MDQDDQKRTVWCGNLSSNCTEELLYELFLQIAPLQKINLCADKDGKKNSYAFITFKHFISVEYAINILNGIHLFDKKIIVRNSNSNNSSMEEKTKRENAKPSHNNSFERFDRSIESSSTPKEKYERRNYNTDRHFDNRYNFENRSRDHRSYNNRSRNLNSYRSHHPYNQDNRKMRNNHGNSY